MEPGANAATVEAVSRKGCKKDERLEIALSFTKVGVLIATNTFTGAGDKAPREACHRELWCSLRAPALENLLPLLTTLTRHKSYDKKNDCFHTR